MHPIRAVLPAVGECTRMHPVRAVLFNCCSIRMHPNGAVSAVVCECTRRHPVRAVLTDVCGRLLNAPDQSCIRTLRFLFRIPYVGFST